MTNRRQEYLTCIFCVCTAAADLHKSCEAFCGKLVTDRFVSFRVAENGDVKTLKAFLDCSITPKPNFIVLAAYNGRNPLLQYCITELRMSKDSSDMYDRTPLLRAVEAGRENIVE